MNPRPMVGVPALPDGLEPTSPCPQAPTYMVLECPHWRKDFPWLEPWWEWWIN